jgi:DNA helicase-2/ATP-dependent DNA helicase PcrA
MAVSLGGDTPTYRIVRFAASALPNHLPEMAKVELRLNYRCGTKIIAASMVALGEERNYQGRDGATEGIVEFVAVRGDITAQANKVFVDLLPGVLGRGYTIDEVAILYRTADQGNAVAMAARAAGIPFVRADNQALARRNSRLGRFVEACASWVVGGWRDATPPFRRLGAEATAIVYGPYASEAETQSIHVELVQFVTSCIGKYEFANEWLAALSTDLFAKWVDRTRNPTVEWHLIDQMLQQTDPQNGRENPRLSHFGGRIEGSGRLTLSTLHSAKGREFDVAILCAMNSDVIPTNRESKTPSSLREARRLFYVGVTRPRHELHIVFKHGAHSPWVEELYNRIPTA